MNLAIICRRTKKRFHSYQELRNLAKRTAQQLHTVEACLACGKYRRKFDPVVDRLKLQRMVRDLAAWYHAGLP